MTASPQQCRPKASACRTLVQPEPLLQVKVVGLFKSSSFQVSKTIAESLKDVKIILGCQFFGANICYRGY